MIYRPFNPFNGAADINSFAILAQSGGTAIGRDCLDGSLVR